MEANSRRISWHGLTEAIKGCASRFPLTVVYVLSLTVLLIADVWTDARGMEWFRVRDVLAYGFSAGALLSLVIYLWSEEYRRPGRGCTMVQAVALLLLTVDCVWLFSIYNDIGGAIILGHAAVMASLAVAVVFISFIGEKRDIVSWNFGQSLFVSVCVSALIALVMTLATGAIYATLCELFGYTDSNVWMTMLLIGSFAIPLLIFLGRIPAGTAKRDAEAKPSRFLSAITKYLFIPTVAIFYGVLYVYGFKILLQWELPAGMVCWPVSGAILACVIIEYLLYPSLQASPGRYERLVARWLPVVLLPLLVLMTVAICRRISDYGITVSRMYMLTLNLWGYAMCAWLWFTRARRISMVPVSCALLFFITSSMPFINYTSLTGMMLHSQVRSMLQECGVAEFPVTTARYNEIVDALPREQENQLEGKFRYLLDEYGRAEVSDMVKVEPGSLRDWDRWSAAVDDGSTMSYSRRVDYHGEIAIPAGFTRLEKVEEYNPQFSYQSGERVTVTLDDVSYTLNVDSIRRVSGSSYEYNSRLEAPLVCCPADGSTDRLLILDGLYYYYPSVDSLSSLGIYGVLLKK